jgi:hypothetical protein
MRSYGRIIGIGVLVIAIIGLGVGLYYFLYERPAEGPPLPGQPAKEHITPPPEKQIPFITLPTLSQSDEWIRKRAKELSNYSKLAEWLKVNDSIRRITAAVDNIADGLSPRAHLGFLDPKKAFQAAKKGGNLIIDPQSYHRYDRVADTFASLDAAGAVRIFQELKPLFQEAYKELGYPNRDFQETLIRAIKELLDTPVVEGDIALKEGVISYYMVDEDLEGLNDAQKHLLRMGPQNTRKIQNKLRAMAVALGVPENQLPRVQMYGK